MIVIVFGVSGAGKTTVGQLLARQLGWAFYEADDFHSQANIDKMRDGAPLTEEDRQPWLQRLREQIERCLAAGENAVFACSALKKSYRLLLRVNALEAFIYLTHVYPKVRILADQKHCGNKSAAIREVLYKEARMQAKLPSACASAAKSQPPPFFQSLEIRNTNQSS